MSRDNDQERLQRRIEQAMHAEAERLKQRERESEGCRQWAAKHSTHQTIRRDPGPVRDRTVSKNPWE